MPFCPKYYMVDQKQKKLNNLKEKPKNEFEKKKLEFLNVNFLLAIESNNLDKFKSLIEEGADVNYQRFGLNPILLASMVGNFEMVQELVENKADINAKHELGWNALMIASRDGHIEIVKFLVENNADINAKDPFGWTALTFALENDKKKISKFLIETAAENFEKNEYKSNVCTKLSSNLIQTGPRTYIMISNNEE
jgi:ankyrin repeat protein